MKTASFNFVNWDDDENIRSNIQYKDLTYDNIKYHFQHSRYKALAIWSFMADATMFGKKTNGFHFHNVLLHIINTLLVFILIKRISQKENIALFTAALFALHPVFVEPVAWVTGRKDLLFVLFLLLSALIYRVYLLKKNKLFWWLLVCIFVYLASLAKIQVFTIPIIFLGFDWFYKRKFSAEIIIEKLMLFFLIWDKWLIFMLLFSLLLLLYFYKNFIVKLIKKYSSPKLLFWYFLFMLFNICAHPISIYINEKEKIYLIAPLITMIIFSIFCVIALKNKNKLTLKLSTISATKKIALVIIPFIIFAIELFFKMFINNAFRNKFIFIFWNIQLGSVENFSFAERFILAPNALLYYILRFFLISPQNPFIAYPEHAADGSLPTHLYTTAAFVYLFIAILIFLFFRYFRKNKVIIFGTIWFLVNISIVLHIIPILGRVLAADRYAYPAYIGLFLIVAYASDFLMQRFNKKLLTGIFTTILIIFSITTFINLDTWKSSKTLWQRALEVKPDNHYAMYSLSLAYFTEDKNPQKAIQYLDKAIELKEDFQYYNNRGRVRYALKDLNGAIEDVNKSILLDSKSFAAYNNRGVLTQQLGNFKEALADFRQAVNLKPDFQEAINNTGKISRLIFLDSIVMNNIPIAPEKKAEIAEFIIKTSQLYINNKQYDKAALYLNRGIEITPTEQQIHEMLAVMYQLNKEYDKALSTYNNGLSILPGNPTLLLGRGLLFIDLRDTIKACYDFSNAASQGNKDAMNLKKQLCGN